ncbi:hypothetical protein SLEP1_g26334 [Rubroshorea leprosula]|uniref:Integrase catalytic domain-containing protein n=1 Tax=Rubroshorea leprosula TaxID=152421 RepID=A0AAV5JPL1_9ROSI|nr:hypothetical protein SLEP1_g26334 [Rubroshorea leprosula]
MAVSYPKSEKFAPTKQEQPAVKRRSRADLEASCRGGFLGSICVLEQEKKAKNQAFSPVFQGMAGFPFFFFRPIYGFNNQPVPVEEVITLPIYVGLEPRFRMTSVTFLVVKMESAFNAILGRATLCNLKAVISQPHLCMKFPTPQGVGVLKGNQKMARAYYQDTFKKVELVAAPAGSEIHRPTRLGQQTMSISDIEHRPKGVAQKAEPIEPVEIVPLNSDVPERTVKIGTKLTKKERVELLEFLRANQDVFAWTTDEMPGIPTELTVHKLSTDPTKRPVVQKCHLFGPEKQATIDEEIQKLLQAGFIKRVKYSEWVSNPVLVKKPNGKWRMCIDFTNLNEACPKDPHPLPNVKKLVEPVAGHERMSFLDASSGYHQVQLLLDDQEKIAFYAESGKFLGYVVSKKGIEVNPEKVQAVQQMEPPRTIKDVQRLTGRIAVLHRFIARSAETCLLFFKALREPKYFQWIDECQQAFDELKQYLASTLLLSKPVERESLYLYLGVTKEAVSSVLLREENKNQKPICYVSKVLQGAEHKYPLAEKAAFALKLKLSGWLIGWSVELSEYDLKFQPCTTIKGQGNCEIKDHQLGRYVSVVNRLKSRFASFQIDKIPRADNQRADELSKLASSQETNSHRSTIVEVLDAPSYTGSTVECQLLSINPSSPSWTTSLIDYLHSGELLEDPSAAKLIKCKAAHFTLLDNQLYKRAASMPLLRYLTPYEAEYAVREVHEGVCGTHIGGRTLARKLLRHGYYWPTMVEDAQNYQKWGVDLLGPFVKGKGGCTYLVVAMDYFTKWIEVKPLSMTTEKKIQEFLFNSILCRFGIPKRVIADNGPQF